MVKHSKKRQYSYLTSGEKNSQTILIIALKKPKQCLANHIIFERNCVYRNAKTV